MFNNTHHGPDSLSTWTKNLRICSPDIFPVYFNYCIPEGQIANTEMKSILALAENTQAFSEKLLELVQKHRPDGLTRASAFLEKMEHYAQKDIPINHVKSILQSFFNVGDKLLVPEDEARGLFGFGNDVRIGRLMFQLRIYNKQNDRFNILKEVFINGQAISMIVHEVAVLGQQQGC